MNNVFHIIIIKPACPPHRVTEQKQVNMMSPENLATVFAPTILRSPETDPLTSLTAVKYERELVDLIISNHNLLFE